MCGKKHIYGLLLASIFILLVGAVSVVAENETVATSEDITVPVEGVEKFVYGPAGFEVVKPEGLNSTTIAEYEGHQVFMFISDDDDDALSIDVVETNMTLEEAVAEWKAVAEAKENYKLTSENETTLGGEPATEIVFSYSDETGDKEETALIAVNNGLEYVILYKTNADEECAMIIQEILDSFTYIPIEEDNISKMVKTKMVKVAAPDKFGWGSSYSYQYQEQYSWDYFGGWGGWGGYSSSVSIQQSMSYYNYWW